jgi:N-acyl-D-amino-acid deacylase
MLSWAVESLMEDGRSMSDIRQGVTLEVMGEGTSMGPLNPAMKSHLEANGLTGEVDGFRYPVEWTTLSGYLQHLETLGVTPNVASFVGAGTLRVHAVGFDDRPADVGEVRAMCALLDAEMQNGAIGLASALIYPPETAISTDELVALGKVVGRSGGLYASHIRSEGTALLEAVEEVVEIARRAQVRAEIYHFKAIGRQNWAKMERAIDAVEAARAAGIEVTANVYPYDFAGTSLTACLPPWAHQGGVDELHRRLRDPSCRERIREAMAETGWENPFLDTGPEHIRLSGALTAELSGFLGMSVQEIAEIRGVSPEEAVMDMVVENGGDVLALYFNIRPENVHRVIRRPWVSVCSDAESLAAEGRSLTFGVHPRAYGSFARVLGPYVRDGVLSLPEAVRRMTSLPAGNLRIRDRGRLRVGFHADVVAFDPATVTDHAVPEDSHRYATGVNHVWVNGTQVLDDGVHTGATPGRFVRGPGWPGR